jgi:GAF domain-containing protein
VTADEHLVSAATAAAKAMNSALADDQVLAVIAGAACRAVPGIDHAGISLTDGEGRVVTAARTDALVQALDDLQERTGEGPSLDALGTAPVIVVQDARHEQRWPGYIAGAVRLGLRAQLAVRVFADERTLGSLNLYSTSTDSLPPAAVDLAELYATDAAIVLGHRRREHHLSEAIRSRQVVGQALGITMERYRVDQEQAMAFLKRASQTTNTKLRVIAEEIVAATKARYERTNGADPQRSAAPVPSSPRS